MTRQKVIRWCEISRFFNQINELFDIETLPLVCSQNSVTIKFRSRWKPIVLSFDNFEYDYERFVVTKIGL